MDAFEFRPDRTTDYGVSCPWASKKYPYRPFNGENGVSTFSLLFLIGSFWYFHVTRTSIKAWLSLNFLKWDLTLAHWTQESDRCPLGYLFNLQQMFEVTRGFCWQQNFVPWGFLSLTCGYIHLLNHEKMCIKSKIEEILFKLLTNDYSDEVFPVDIERVALMGCLPLPKG